MARIARSGSRGAALIESLVVISIMILFFLGMVFFQGMYAQKLRAISLARSAVMAHAINACQDGVLDYVQTQIDGTTTVPGDQLPGGTLDIPGLTAPQLGLSGNAPVSGWLNTLNLGAQQPTSVKSTTHFTASTQGSGGQPGTKFQANPATESFALCGDQGRPGNYPNVVSSISIQDAFPF